jgi:UDP-N-acetylglucosamine--N-acetylmuramyl-(pentapeptide) pyrophosphoryl-undecaprenol N-acetylglucosamine transferase
MSDIVPFAIEQLPDALRARLDVVQQCRPEDLARVKSAYEAAGVACELNEFFDNMPARIAEAHLVIGRSGASTISELAVIGRPSILVPLPHSIDQDQLANAEVLSLVGAAWVIDQPAFTPEALAARLDDLFTQPDQLARAAAAAKTQSSPHAVTQLADLVETLGQEGRAGVEAQVRAHLSSPPSQKDISS